MSDDKSPAEKYAAMKERNRQRRIDEEIAKSAHLVQFAALLSYDLDPFQLRACHALEEGSSVLVAAPTGAGKTVVGEFAIHLAVRHGVKVFYTTPIKALSNQKFQQLQSRYGADMVGLLTGDTVINGEAPIVVMTTEVLRNMIYAGSRTLDTLGYVVLDEVHYLADKFRGAVWEEVIIHLRQSVQLVCLSATVSNAEEFGAWLDEVRGNTQVIVSEHRPVPLWQHMLVRSQLFDVFIDENGEAVAAQGPNQSDKMLNPDLEQALTGRWGHARPGSGKRDFGRRGGRAGRQSQHEAPFGRGERGAKRGGPGAKAWESRERGEVARAEPGLRDRPLRRPEVLKMLDDRGLLPAITFVFSRIGCDDAVLQCLRDDVVLTTPEQEDEIYAYATSQVRDIPDADLNVLHFRRWLRALCNGYAAHHAGLLPRFKEIIEHLFARGLVKAVFATETLALGVNMPARTVVIEKLVKWDGSGHVDITPGEFTQLTGRAGRRGIDVEGHSVVVAAPGITAEQVGGLASKRTYPLRSSFVPTCNMAVNLVAQVGVSRATDVLETSFAQFQADRSVVGLARRARELQEGVASYRKAAFCEAGDVQQYFSLRQAITRREHELKRQRSQEARNALVSWLKALRVGSVIRVVAGKTQGFVVVVDNGVGSGSYDHKGDRIDEPRPQVITLDGRLKRLGPQDFPERPEPLGEVRLPRHVQVTNAKARRDIASQMRSLMHRQGRLGRHGDEWDYEQAQREAAELRAAGEGADAPGAGLGADAPGAGLGADGAGAGLGAAGAGAGPGGAGGRRGKHSVPSRAPGDTKLQRLKDDLSVHPVHACPEREAHMRWMERWNRTGQDLKGLQRTIASRTDSIGAHFVKLVGLLASLGYLDTDEDGTYLVTPAGERLRRIYGEQDLLIAECIRAGVWDDLDVAGLATAVSAVIFQARRDEGLSSDFVPEEDVQRAISASQDLWRDIVKAQRQHRVTELAPLDTSMAPMMYRWARGASLADTLRGSDQAAGDFVRWSKQVIDVLDQVSSDESLRPTAKAAVELVRRGIVAQTVASAPTHSPGPSSAPTPTHSPGPTPTPTPTHSPGPTPTPTPTHSPGPTPTPTPEEANHEH
ncbi:DEAD/DEAH box helicase [Micrococcales bacterium 31B]|nr:DEAD/DEAH box helicase [Micrococcales bacterium 31B]